MAATADANPANEEPSTILSGVADDNVRDSALIFIAAVIATLVLPPMLRCWFRRLNARVVERIKRKSLEAFDKTVAIARKAAQMRAERNGMEVAGSDVELGEAVLDSVEDGGVGPSSAGSELQPMIAEAKAVLENAPAVGGGDDLSVLPHRLRRKIKTRRAPKMSIAASLLAPASLFDRLSRELTQPRQGQLIARVVSGILVYYSTVVFEDGIQPSGAGAWRTLNRIANLAAEIFLMVAAYRWASALVEALIVTGASFAQTQSKSKNRQMSGIEKELLPLVGEFVHMIFGIVFLLMCLGQLDINVTGFVAFATVLALAVALAAGESLKSIFGLLFVLYEQPFDVGDKIEIGGYSGRVERLSLRCTVLRHPWTDALTFLPNAAFLADPVVNIEVENWEFAMEWCVAPWGLEEAVAATLRRETCGDPQAAGGERASRPDAAGGGRGAPPFQGELPLRGGRKGSSPFPRGAPPSHAPPPPGAQTSGRGIEARAQGEACLALRRRLFRALAEGRAAELFKDVEVRVFLKGGLLAVRCTANLIGHEGPRQRAYYAAEAEFTVLVHRTMREMGLEFATNPVQVEAVRRRGDGEEDGEEGRAAGRKLALAEWSEGAFAAMTGA